MIYIHYQTMGDVWYAAAIEDEKVWATAFALNKGRVLQFILESLPFNREFQIAEKLSSRSERILKTLHLIYMGENVSWDFQLEMRHLSSYARKVFSFLLKVPVGYVTTYQALARVVGGSPRAVGRIMAMNPFAPLIPCHRVVCADFTLGGYGLDGARVKCELLQREDRGFKEPTHIKLDGETLALFPVRYLWKKLKLK